jgi:hypothetical protein
MFMEVFTVAAWSISKERNNQCFNGVNHNIASWKARFQQDFSLLVHRTKEELHPFITLLSNNI